MKKIYVLLLILLILRIVYAVYSFNFSYSNDIKYSKYIAKVHKVKSVSDTSSSFVVLLQESNFKHKVILNVYERLELNKGDIIEVVGKLKVPQLLNNPAEFNYKRYLNSINIYAVITAKSVERVEKAEKSFDIQDRISNIVDKSLTNYDSQLLQGIIYGDDGSVNKELKDSFKTIGISHIVSASGSNLSIVIALFSAVWEKFRINKKVKKILQCIISVIFLSFTSLGYSILRATLCFLISNILSIFNKKISTLKCMSISLYIVLLINPYSIFNLGLQLSYLATLGIVLFNRKIYNILKIQESVKKKLNLKKRIFNYFLKIILLSLTAQILVIPLQIQYFNYISLTSILANIVSYIIVTPLTILGLIGIILGFIFPVSYLVLKMTIPFLWLIKNITSVLCHITPKIQIPTQKIYIVFLYYVVIFAVWYILSKVGNIRKIRGKYIRLKYIFAALLIFLYVIFVVCINVYTIYLESFIYFFNVEQGSTALLKLGKYNVLLDCGSTRSNLSFNVLDSYFKSMAIDTIDSIIISHFHTDHISAIESLIQNYNVKCIYYASPPNENYNFENITKEADKNSVQMIELSTNDTFYIGKCKFNVLISNAAKGKNDDLNVNSTVVNINVNNKNYLFMGDATKETETEMLKRVQLNSVYLLVVGHHGSKNATSDEFIQKIKPKVSVISCKKSVYGHPAEEVIEILKKHNSKILITEKLGAIKIKI